MSFEGYDQKLCAKGHLRTVDVYDWDSQTQCSCGEPFVWSHTVDQTNCDGEEYPLVIAREAELQACDLGHHHVVREAEYVIPSRRAEAEDLADAKRAASTAASEAQ